MTKQGLDNLVCVGQFAGAFGVAGAVKLLSYTDNPGDVVDYFPLLDEISNSYELERVLFRKKNTTMVMIKGVSDRDAAQALSGKKLYVARERLPKLSQEEFYHVDLVGAKVLDDTGADFGVVEDVCDYGSGPFLQIRTADNKIECIPLNDKFVEHVDAKNKICKLMAYEVAE